MLILLPPSESKRVGGRPGSALRLQALRWPQLTDRRRTLVRAVSELAVDEDATVRALHLGPRQRGEVARNRELVTSPTLPALDRYTGVLYEALDAESLSEDARAFAYRHVAIHSALFGLVGAGDPIPAYRLSHDSRLPGLRLARHWPEAIAAALATEQGPVIDLRSDGYVALGPLPARADAVTVRVVTADAGRRPVNHFNKRSKGLFVRALLESGRAVDSVTALIQWAREAGFTVAEDGSELRLVELRASRDASARSRPAPTLTKNR